MDKFTLSRRDQKLVDRVGVQGAIEELVREGANNLLRPGESYNGFNNKIIAQSEGAEEDITNKDNSESKESMLGRLGTTIRKLFHNA